MAKKSRINTKNENLTRSTPLGRSSQEDAAAAANLGHSEMSEALSQEVMPADDLSPSKKGKKKSKRAKTKPRAKNRELRPSSTLGRSSDGDDAARLGHSEMSEALSQEVTPADDLSPSKKRKKKPKRSKKKRKAKSQNLESSSNLGRSSQEDDAARLGHFEVSEALSQEVMPDTNQGSSVKNPENLTQPENLNIKDASGRKTLEKERKHPEIFEAIKKYPKRLGEKILKEFEKKIIGFLLGVVLYVVGMCFPFLGSNTMTSGTPMAQQGQTQVINNMYCSVSESASPVAITPKQPDLRADSNSTQIYCVCCIVQQ